jgi:type IV pilus assembly protein PilW
MKNRYKQHGMTLIEIMIALIIGAFLIGGVLKIFLNTQQTYRVQENLSRIQENGRFALEFLSRDLRMADYRACHTDSSDNTAITGTNNATATPPDTGTDTITIKWKKNACGASTATSTRLFRINNATLQRDANDGSGFQSLIENIEDMQILYGVDTDADKTPNYYVDADNVADWSQVISVQIALSARSNDANLVTSGDTRLHRTFNTTVVLRNRM